MKKFLSVFVAPVESYDKMKEEMKSRTPEEAQKGMEEWKVWMEKHKADIVDPGAPVGSAKRINKDGITDIRNTIGGYMIIAAEDADAAAQIFDDSPHFGIEDGGVEIMEIVSM